jgi:hypothetical protein
MKLITMFLLSVFLGKGCSSATQNDIKNAVVEYTANTRGFYQKVVIQNQMIAVSKDRNETKMPAGKKISDADWKILLTEFQKLDLEKLPELVGPTEKRFYDGAAIANINITYKGKTYESLPFDHGTPHSDIEKFVKKINALAPSTR